MNTFKEFHINKYITLKLEDDLTFIYVNNKKFEQCKHLLFQIRENQRNTYTEITSIDDAEKQLGTLSESVIPPEDEFWGHCSNL